MPIRAYFGVMFLALAAALLLVSTYLEPHRPSATVMLFGAHDANGVSEKPTKSDVDIFYKLRALPIAARS